MTGGSRGIGLATARALLERGARVAITATSDATLRAGTAELEKVSGAGAVLPIRADVREHGGGGAGVRDGRPALRRSRRAREQRRRRDIPFRADMTVDEWQRVIDTNLTGVFYCCRAALPHLRTRGGGWIINISSLVVHQSIRRRRRVLRVEGGGSTRSARRSCRRCGTTASASPACCRARCAPISAVDSSSGSDDWKLAPDDVAQVVADLIAHPPRSLPSRVEIRPSQPPRKG